MSRTYKHPKNQTLFRPGRSNSHKSLKLELRESNAIMVDGRGLLDRRDYQSDRMKGWRKEGNGTRRAYLKRNLRKILEEK